MTQMLAPIVTLFKRDGMNVISNNSLSKDTLKVLDSSSAKYKYMLTKFTDYNDDIFANAQTYIRGKTTIAIGANVFTKVQINQLFMRMHERDKNNWDEERIDYEDQAYEEVKRSNQEEQDALDDAEILLAKIEKERKEREIEDNKQVQKAQAESKKASQQAAEESSGDDE
jgi:hypothetical protein